MLLASSGRGPGTAINSLPCADGAHPGDGASPNVPSAGLGWEALANLVVAGWLREASGGAHLQHSHILEKPAALRGS